MSSQRVGVVVTVKFDLLRNNVPDRTRNIPQLVVGSGDG